MGMKAHQFQWAQVEQVKIKMKKPIVCLFDAHKNIQVVYKYQTSENGT